MRAVPRTKRVGITCFEEYPADTGDTLELLVAMRGSRLGGIGLTEPGGKKYNAHDKHTNDTERLQHWNILKKQVHAEKFIIKHPNLYTPCVFCASRCFLAELNVPEFIPRVVRGTHPVSLSTWLGAANLL
jgi:hypothetical protein